MMHRCRRWLTLLFLIGCAASAFPQSQPATVIPSGSVTSTTVVPDERHDISMVDEVTPGNSMATPLPQQMSRRLKKYEIPELTGARQALGSQLIDGHLPRPLFDYYIRSEALEQRISMFEGGLVVVRMSGAGGTLSKKLILPADAAAAYRKSVALQPIREAMLLHGDTIGTPPAGRHAELRVYDDRGEHQSVRLDPAAARPKTVNDAIGPIEDLLRAISEDRTVTNTVANYNPKVGDELVGEDRKVWRVQRLLVDSGTVELRCQSQPTTIFVARKDLYNYFVGARGAH
jgi:hypothetical protein